jgi:hypothetical protein
MQDNLATDYAIHEKNVPTQTSVGWRDTHEGTHVRSRHRHACGDRLSFGDLLVDVVLKIRKGGTHERMALKDLMKSRVLSERGEVVPVESLQETANHGLGFFFCR